MRDARVDRLTSRVANRDFVRQLFLIAIALLTSVSCATAQHPNDNHHTEPSNSSGTPAEVSETQDWAKQRLAKSPRHQEWVKVKNGNREVNSFIVYPEVKSNATAVIVIHEIFGMTDWVQSVADQLAEAGYIAIAPDLLSGMGPNGGGTSSFTERNAVGQTIRDLPPDQIAGDLNAVATYVSKVTGANGKVVVGGFCWGGAQTFRYATNNPNIKAGFVFYGGTPMITAEGPEKGMVDKTALAKIKAPIYGFYAGNDARINAALPKTIEAMKELGKTYDPVTYEGAGHGFMRAGEDPANTVEANKKARDEAWARWKELLKKI